MDLNDTLDRTAELIQTIRARREMGLPAPAGARTRLQALREELERREAEDSSGLIAPVTALISLVLETLPPSQDGADDAPRVPYAEIHRLHRLLLDADIPHDFGPCVAGGYQLCYFGHAGAEAPVPDGRAASFVCLVCLTAIGKGGEDGLLELHGLLTPEEEQQGFVDDLTAEAVLRRIRLRWTSEQA